MKTTYKIGEFALLINVSISTLKRWDTENILVAYRNPKGRRYYTRQQFLLYKSNSLLLKGKKS